MHADGHRAAFVIVAVVLAAIVALFQLRTSDEGIVASPASSGPGAGLRRGSVSAPVDGATPDALVPDSGPSDADPPATRPVASRPARRETGTAVTGRVVDEHRRFLPGARVILMHRDLSPDGDEKVVIDKMGVSDADGRFRFDDVFAGPALVSAALPDPHDLRSSSIAVTLVEKIENDVGEVAVTTDGKARLEFIVRRANGSPAVGALVNVCPYDPDEMNQSGITDAAGVVRFACWKAGGAFTFTAAAPNEKPATGRIVPEKERPFFEAALDSRGRLARSPHEWIFFMEGAAWRGTIVLDGTEVPGDHVHLTLAAPEGDDGRKRRVYVFDETSETLIVEDDLVLPQEFHGPPGRWEIEVADVRYATSDPARPAAPLSALAKTSFRTEIEMRGRTQVTPTSAAPILLRGRLLRDGMPLAGASVMRVRTSGIRATGEIATTDASGKFTIGAPGTLDRVRVLFSAKGAKDVTRDVNTFDATTASDGHREIDLGDVDFTAP